MPPTLTTSRRGSIEERAHQLLRTLDDPHPVPAAAVARAIAELDQATIDLQTASRARQDNHLVTAVKADGRGQKRLQRAAKMLLQGLIGPTDRAPTPPAALFHDALESLAQAAQDVDDAADRYEHAMIERGREQELLEDPAASLLGALASTRSTLDDTRRDLERRYKTAGSAGALLLPRIPRG